MKKDLIRKIGEIDFKEKIKKHKFLVICFIITLLFFGNMCRLEFSRCTYRMYSNDYMSEYKHFLVIGRFVTALFWKFVNVIGLSITKTYILSYLIGVVSVTLSIYLLFDSLKSYIKNNTLNLLLSVAIIINVYILDYFMYLEKGIFGISILLCVLSFKYLLKYFDTSLKRNLIYSFILLCVSSFSYQGTAALYIGLATIFIVKYTKNILTFIKNNILTAGIYGLSMGISFVLIKVIGGTTTSRTTGELYLAESIKKASKGLYDIFLNSYGLMPKYFFAAVFGLIFILSIIIICFVREQNKKDVKTSKKIIRKVLLLLGFIYSLSGCVIAAILPQLVIDTSAISVTPRAVYAFASIIGLAIVYLLANIDCEFKISNKFFISVITIFLLVQCYCFNEIITDHYTLNYIEKQYAYLIGEQIEKYEIKTGVKIKNIVFYTDMESERTYSDLKSYADINERVFRTRWSRVEILKYYMNRDFKQTWEQNKEYKKEFENVDYNKFDINQLKFEGDTLHLCIY